MKPTTPTHSEFRERAIQLLSDIHDDVNLECEDSELTLIESALKSAAAQARKEAIEECANQCELFETGSGKDFAKQILTALVPSIKTGTNETLITALRGLVQAAKLGVVPLQSQIDFAIRALAQPGQGDEPVRPPGCSCNF